jgi:hypothetical protein
VSSVFLPFTQPDPGPSNATRLTSPPLSTSIHGLNLPIPETARDVIKPWDARDSTDKYAESNVDDQLIIHVPFLESVRIKSILIKTGRGDLAPQNLNVYTNPPTIVDFADAESGNVKPQLETALKTDEAGVVEYPVKAAVFGNISSLSLFFVSVNWVSGTGLNDRIDYRKTRRGETLRGYIMWGSKEKCDRCEYQGRPRLKYPWQALGTRNLWIRRRVRWERHSKRPRGKECLYGRC